MGRKLISVAIAVAAAMGVLVGTARVTPAAEVYKIGYITDLSGPLAGSYTPTWEGFELYIKALNARGGVKGRTVELYLDDDGLKADRAVANAKKQAERDGVLAIFGLSLSSTQAPVYTEMRKIGVPVVSTFSGILDALPPAKPYSYSAGVVFEVAGEAIGELLPKIAPKGRVVGMTIDSVGGRAALRHNRQAAEALGYTWDEVVFPVAAADFTPFAQAAVQKKPDVVVGHYGASQNLGVIPALRKAGFDGPYVVAVYGVPEDVVLQAAEKAGTGKDLYFVTRYATIHDEAPGVRQARAAAERYGTGKPFSTMHIHGWALGKLAEAALTRCGWPCSREALDKAIQTLKIDTEGMTGGPIEMSPEDHYGPSYWRAYRWDEKTRKLAPVSDWLKKGRLRFSAQ